MSPCIASKPAIPTQGSGLNRTTYRRYARMYRMYSCTQNEAETRPRAGTAIDGKQGESPTARTAASAAGASSSSSRVGMERLAASGCAATASIGALRLCIRARYAVDAIFSWRQQLERTESLNNNRRGKHSYTAKIYRISGGHLGKGNAI